MKKAKQIEVTREEATGAEPEARDREAARNNVRKIREALLMSKAELARKAGLSALTIDRIESGYECRVDTKRKIILALGLKLTDKDKVFGSSKSDSDE